MPAQGQMLIAIDFSASCDEAVALAAKLARRSDGEVLLLHVDPTAETAPLTSDAMERRDRLRAALEEARRLLDDRGISTITILRPGDPAREILRVAQARAPQIIVM